MKGLKESTLHRGETYLVPYIPQHVEIYNEYMKDEDIQRLTNSEPLSLAEEHEMQQRWATEDDMLCFIITDAPDGIALGDVNLHLHEDEDNPGKQVAEIGVMVCAKGARRKGHAKNAIMLVLESAFKVLHVGRVEARIRLDNHPSRTLFTAMGFEEESMSEIFGEVTMVLTLSQQVIEKWQK